MDKATKAIRRSGVRLKSLSSGHGDLQMIISQLGDVRTSFKAFAVAQGQASEDALKWAASHENRAISETFTHLAELALVWTDVQRDFSERLKDYRSMYELILEGERHVTQARETMVAREQREAKLRKEYKKASKKAPAEEVVILKERLSQAEKAKDLAHLELVERVGENEAVKMIRVKEGLLKLSSAYCEMAQKCLIIFNAHQNVSAQLPDVHERDLHDVKYTGSEAALKYVLEAKELVRSYRRNSISNNKPPLPDDPPPPYYPSLEDLDDCSKGKRNGFDGGGHPSAMSNGYEHPTAPRASTSSLVNGVVGRGGAPHTHNGGANSLNGVPRPRPTAPDISSSTINSPTSNGLPVLPSSHVYPDLPENPNRQPVQVPTNLPTTHPTTCPTSPVTPATPDTYPNTPHFTPHFQSVPNLGDGSSFDQGLRYPPLNINDNNSFNDSNFHPDTSSSSPNLLSRRLSTSSARANTPPFNPYYDWLPAHMHGRAADGKPANASLTNGCPTNENPTNDSPPQLKPEKETASNSKSKEDSGSTPSANAASDPKSRAESGSTPNANPNEEDKSKSKSVKHLLTKSKPKNQAPPTPDMLKDKADVKQAGAGRESDSSKDKKTNIKTDRNADQETNPKVRSVRPKEGKNPFWDDSTDEEDNVFLGSCPPLSVKKKSTNR